MEIKKALSYAKQCLASNDLIPILTHICFNEGKMYAFNGVQGIEIPVDYDLSCTVQGDTFIKLLNTLSSFSLIQNETNIEISVIGKMNIRLNSLPFESSIFTLPDLSRAIRVDLGRDFITGIRKCFSSSTNDREENLNGVALLTEREHKSFLFATDSIRLSEYQMEDCIDEDISIMLPRQFCQLLMSFENDCHSLVFFVGDDFVCAQIEDTMLYSKIIPELSLVDYKGIAYQIYMTADSYIPVESNMIDAVHRCIIVSKVTYQPKVLINISNNGKIYFSSDSNIGNIAEIVDIDGSINMKQAHDLTINGDYLKHALNNVEFFTFNEKNIFIGKDDRYTQIVSTFHS